MLNSEHSIPMKEIHLEREAILNIEQLEMKCSESLCFYTVPSWRVRPLPQHVTLTICERACQPSSAKSSSADDFNWCQRGEVHADLWQVEGKFGWRQNEFLMQPPVCVHGWIMFA